jgi:hypothetical protein
MVNETHLVDDLEACLRAQIIFQTCQIEVGRACGLWTADLEELSQVRVFVDVIRVEGGDRSWLEIADSIALYSHN